MIHPQFRIECNPARAVMENFSVRTGQAVEDLMLSDVESMYHDIAGIVEREFDWSERITDRMGE
jgi:hypothetical protein